MKSCIVVLGMHRSGTSVLSGLVSLQGFHLGVSQMPVREDNPKGFFENFAIYSFNQKILEDHGVSWDDYSFVFDDISEEKLVSYRIKAREIIKAEFGIAKKIFIKDPRMCILFPLWETVLKDLGFRIKVIVVYRSPMEVALSLKARNDFVLEKSLLLWSHYSFQAILNTQSYEKKMFVQFSRDYTNLDVFLQKLAGFAGIELNSAIIKASHDLYSPKLKHHQVSLENISDELPMYLRDFIAILKDDGLKKAKKIDCIIKEFYLSQELFLYDLNPLHNKIALLESDKKTLQKKHSFLLDEFEQFKINAQEQKKELLNTSSKRLKEVEEKYKAILKEEVEKANNIQQSLSEKADNIQQSLSKELNKKQDKIDSLIASLSVGEQLFIALQKDRVWKKKFARLLKNSHYFRMKRRILPLSKAKNKRFMDDKIEIIKSGLFSPFYYLTRYPVAWNNQVDPLNFFNKHGWKERQNPSPYFDTAYYLKENKDVEKLGVNPLLHYIRIGKDEGRLPRLPLSHSEQQEALTSRNDGAEFATLNSPKKDTSKGGVFTRLLSWSYSGPTRGSVTTFSKNIISGWFVSKDKYTLPIIMVDGGPTKDFGHNLVDSTAPADINHNVGFKAGLYTSIHEKSKIELLQLSEKGVTPVEAIAAKNCQFVANKYVDLDNALRVSKQKNSVAITVWEGAHNPIGRAKVLYDVLSTKRPVVIFAYAFGDFGDSLWEPLRNSGLNVVLIPYAERFVYKSYIQRNNITFDTIWICKHRLHSFELASIISKPSTACVLDIDDNEDAFVVSEGSKLKPYGIYSKNKANYYLSKVVVRSVASVSLQEEFGGKIVRHARNPFVLENKVSISKTDKVAVFIGTVRAHKHVDSLVSAVTSFNKKTKENIKLAIGGDFNPISLRRTLKTKNTIILDKISNENLFSVLAKYDVVITGYPGKDKKSLEINRFQITSKIGDGLAVGLPVLTPFSPAVADLTNIPGLFLFTKNNFDEKLREAIDYSNEVRLPEQFSLDYSYKVFEELEKKAKSLARAKNIFGLEPMYQKENNIFSGVSTSNKVHGKHIVLLWKQQDSGVYGRRIDHVARYYKQKHPDANVTIIEAIHEDAYNSFNNSSILFDNLRFLLDDVMAKKASKYSRSGVNYRLITYKNQSGWNSFEQKFDCFLSSEGIYPNNSLIVLFPLLDVYKDIIRIVQQYKVLVDLVDNQVKWMKKPEVRLKGLKQYYELISIADEVVANSSENIRYFRDLNFFDEITPKFIANWYTLPDGLVFEKTNIEGEINLIYSGNLNDRIDWGLFKEICQKLEAYNGCLHIVGTTVRSAEEMLDLLNYCPNCVYHGVINENQLLGLLQTINFAVVPHIEDDISRFMDPIKLKMYKKLGIVTLCSQLPGLSEEDSMLLIADSKAAFLNKLDELLVAQSMQTVVTHDKAVDDEVGSLYMKVIEGLLP